MGYDYRTGGSSPVGSVAPLDRTGYDISDTIAAYTRPGPAVEADPRRAVLRPRLVDEQRAPSTPTNTSGTKFGASTTVVYDTAADYLAQYGRQLRRRRGRRLDRLPAPELHRDLRLRHLVAPALLRRRGRAQREVRPRQQLRPARRRDLGPRLRRRAARAVGRDPRKFLHDTTPPEAGIADASRRDQANPGFTVAGPAGTTRGRELRRPGLDRRRRLDGLADRRRRRRPRSGPALDGHGYAFRVRARDPQGNVGAWNVASTLGRRGSGARGRRLRRRPRRRLPIRAAPDTSAPMIGDVLRAATSSRSSAGRARRRLHLVPGRRPARRVAGRRRRSRRGLDRRRGSGRRCRRRRRRTRPASRGARRPRLRQRRRRERRHVGGRGRPPRVLAERRRVGRRARDRLDEHRAFDSLVLRVFRADGTLVGSVPAGRPARGRPAGRLERHGSGRRPLPNGRYLAQPRRHAGGTTFYNPVRRSGATALARLRRDDRHRRPDRSPRPSSSRRPHLARTATGSSTRPGRARRDRRDGWTFSAAPADRLDRRRRRSRPRPGSAAAPP